MESIDVGIGHLLDAHRAGIITGDECADGLAILRHRAEMLDLVRLNVAGVTLDELAEAVNMIAEAMERRPTERDAG
jgi:hypothetical protein